MGGADKAMLALGGKPLVAHVLNRLQPQVAALAISANGDADRFSAYGVPVLADTICGQPGPLAGVLAGMEWAQGMGFSAIVTVATDTPFFPRDLVRRLRDSQGPEGLCLAAFEDRAGVVQNHPTFGLWPVRLRDDLRQFLISGGRKVGRWCADHAAGQAVFSAEIDPFFNINTPDDLREAERIAASVA